MYHKILSPTKKLTFLKIVHPVCLITDNVVRSLGLAFISGKSILFIPLDPNCIDEQDGIGRTALSYAVHFHQNEMLNYLLENEADVNITSHGMYM